MAYYPAHCDNNCTGCEKNHCGWCDWNDKATPEYKPEVIKANSTKLVEDETGNHSILSV